NDPCLTVVEYDYVQAGNPFVFKFPLVNNMVIAEVSEQTSILVNPICPSILIESFRMKITGLPYLHDVVENIPPFALFNNTGNNVLGRNFGPGNYKLTITGYSQDNGQGSVVYGPIDTHFTIVANNASISAPTFTINSLCAGSTFNVNFTTIGAFNPANQFDVQLSDANGTFSNPTIIGSAASAGVVACTIPLSISLGSNYRIRVVSTNQTLTGTSNNSNLTSVSSSLILLSPTDDVSSGTSTKQASKTITATNKILSPANTIYKAGNSILLSAGFQVNSNSVFKAEIGGCN
ncbi:MAG: 3-coathanger stack domain-containing protein, partial [Emticicia sp.]